MTKLTFFGGVGEIGGNKILVESEEGSVLLDFGRRMGVKGSYYSEFLQVRTRNALRDLLRLGVLPRIDGVYDEKYLDTTTLLENPGDIEKIPVDMTHDYWITESVEPYDPGVDAVFISHAHLPHVLGKTCTT